MTAITFTLTSGHTQTLIKFMLGQSSCKISHSSIHVNWNSNKIIPEGITSDYPPMKNPSINTQNDSLHGVDDLLFQNFKKGDKQAFKKIYDLHYNLLVFIAGRCGIQDEQKYDIVQDTFFKFYQHRKNLSSAASIKSWLATSVKNACIDLIRKRRTEQRKHEEIKELSTIHESHVQKISSESIQHELEISLLAELIDDITNKTGDDTFAMFYKEGLSVKEISKITQESVGTITSRISRQRKNFKLELQKKISVCRESQF